MEFRSKMITEFRDMPLALSVSLTKHYPLSKLNAQADFLITRHIEPISVEV